MVSSGDDAAARSLVLHREAYGAFRLDQGRPRLLIAPAASIVASQVLTDVATQTGVSAGQLEDVAPLAADDPWGMAFITV